MTAILLLPAQNWLAPMVLVVARIGRERARRGKASVPTWIFVTGYLAACTALGLLAYAVYRLVAVADPGFLAWDEHGPLVSGSALALAASTN